MQWKHLPQYFFWERIQQQLQLLCHSWRATITLGGRPTNKHFSGHKKKWYCEKLHNNTAVVIETTTVVTMAWVNVPNINARNTLDFIGLEYFFFLTLRTSWGDMMGGDGSFTLFHSATTFRVTFTFSYVHYLYSKAVYFHHLKWEYCNHGIPRLSLSLSHTHLCTLIHICMDNTCSFAVGELPKSS